MFPSYRNQSVDLQSKSTDWFLCDGNIGRETVKTPTLWVFVRWLDDETDFDENEDVYRKRSSSKTSGKGNFIRFELQNKQSPQVTVTFKPKADFWISCFD